MKGTVIPITPAQMRQLVRHPWVVIIQVMIGRNAADMIAIRINLIENARPLLLINQSIRALSGGMVKASEFPIPMIRPQVT
jgi:hypothetical protein